VENDEPDLIMISETWTNEEISNAELQITGYNLVDDMRLDRTDTVNGLGGGLIIYSRTGLTVRKNERVSKIKFNQYVALTIMTSPPLDIILIYRPPNSGIQNMEGLCELIDSADKNTILVGDFNLPEINWKDETSGPRGRKVLMKAQYPNS
jgi:Endonuclease-reverse transcriptase